LALSLVLSFGWFKNALIRNDYSTAEAAVVIAIRANNMEQAETYYLEYNDCLVYLPKSVILITDLFKDSLTESSNKKIYYYYNYNNLETGGEDLDDYKDITNNCINK
jgi:hypothetical protein